MANLDSNNKDSVWQESEQSAQRLQSAFDKGKRKGTSVRRNIKNGKEFLQNKNFSNNLHDKNTSLNKGNENGTKKNTANQSKQASMRLGDLAKKAKKRADQRKGKENPTGNREGVRKPNVKGRESSDGERGITKRAAGKVAKTGTNVAGKAIKEGSKKIAAIIAANPWSLVVILAFLIMMFTAGVVMTPLKSWGDLSVSDTTQITKTVGSDSINVAKPDSSDKNPSKSWKDRNLFSKISYFFGGVFQFKKDGSIVSKKVTEKVSKKEEERLKEAQGDINEEAKIYTEYIKKYLDEAYDMRKNEVDDVARQRGYDYELTAESFTAQGNPFANVNYAAVLAAYNVMDDDATSSLLKFKQFLKDAEEKMLQVSYKDAKKKVITPVPVYKYKKVTLKVTNREYLLNSGDNSKPVRDGVIYTINKNIENEEKQISSINRQISDLNATKSALNNRSSSNAMSSLEKEIHKKEAKKKTYEKLLADKKLSSGKRKSTRKKYNKVISELDVLKRQFETSSTMERYRKEQINNVQAQIDSLNGIKSNLTSNIRKEEQRIDRIERNKENVSISMVCTEYLNKKTTIKEHAVKLDKNGDKVVKHEVGADEEASGYKTRKYREVQYNGKIYYHDEGETIVYPIVNYVPYGEAELHPFDSTNPYELFGIDPDDTYIQAVPDEFKLSDKDDAHTIFSSEETMTNKEAYNYFYKYLAENTDMASYSIGGDGVQHGGTMTKEQIQAYLNAMPEGTSGNRKAFVGTMLSVCGGINYQFGGKSSVVGWDNSWWTPINTSDKFKGLDCSGAVSWALHTAWTNESGSDSTWSHIMSTGAIASYCTPIKENMLMPGDLALRYPHGSTSRSNASHVWVYVCEQNGQHVWVDHGGGTGPKIHIGKEAPDARYFYRIPALETLEGSNYWSGIESIKTLPSVNAANEDELMVCAYVMKNESDSSDAGRAAVMEASCNHLILGGHQSSVHDLYMLVTNQYDKNYAYKGNEAKTVYFKRHKAPPTQADFAIVLDAVAGKRKQILDSRVDHWWTASYWYKKGGCIWGIAYKEIDGNMFFRANNR